MFQFLIIFSNLFKHIKHIIQFVHNQSQYVKISCCLTIFRLLFNFLLFLSSYPALKPSQRRGLLINLPFCRTFCVLLLLLEYITTGGIFFFAAKKLISLRNLTFRINVIGKIFMAAIKHIYYVRWRWSPIYEMVPYETLVFR